MKKCITACRNCLKVMGKNTGCYKSCMDCLHICSFLVKTKIYCSENDLKLLKLCVQCCVICIEECKKHPKIKECNKCIEECTKCIQEIITNNSEKLKFLYLLISK